MTTFVPYWNPEPYLKDLENSGTDITELKRLHEEFPPSAETYYTKKAPLVLNTTPLEKLYAKYPCKKPPLDERIKACHEAGYPEEKLLDIMKKDAKRVAEKPELEKFLFDIFGEVSEKKTSSVKKKTIHQILKIRKQYFALPEPDDEELPNEDAVVEDADIDE
jgi:hypothetical protein